MQCSSDRHGGGGAGSAATAVYPGQGHGPWEPQHAQRCGPAPAARMAQLFARLHYPTCAL